MKHASFLGLSPSQALSNRSKVGIGTVILLVALSSVADAAPSPGELAVPADCRHVVQDNDTMSRIARERGIDTYKAIHEESPWIADANMIMPGQILNICVDDEIGVEVSSATATQEWPRSSRMAGRCADVDDEANRRLLATALIQQMPAGNTQSDVVSLVSASGVESLFGCDIWNPNDAGQGYIGSIGMLQIRTLPSGHSAAQDAQFDSFRNHQRILGTCDFAQVTQVPATCFGDLTAQADGIWTIFNQMGFNEGSWGAVPHISNEDRQLAEGSVDFVWNSINPQTGE